MSERGAITCLATLTRVASLENCTQDRTYVLDLKIKFTWQSHVTVQIGLIRNTIAGNAEHVSPVTGQRTK